MLYKAVLTCDRGWIVKVWPLKWKLPSSTFLWCCLLCCTNRWFEVINLWTKSLREAIKKKHQAMNATQHFSFTVYHTAPSGVNIKHPTNTAHFRVEDCVLCTVQNFYNDTLAWLTFAVFLFFAVLLLFSLLFWLVTERLLFNSVAVRRCGRSLSSPVRMK